MEAITDYKKSPQPYWQPEFDADHAVLGPTCDRPLYEGLVDDEHQVVGPVYPRPHLRSEYDHILFHNQMEQTERYKNLKPEVVIRLLGERHKYTYLKKLAVEHLKENMRKQLSIFGNLYKCENYSKEPDEELSHAVFSWSLEDFLKRRQLKEFVWVDVLQMTPEPCLNVYKFKQDLEQMQTFLQSIFEGLLSNMAGEDVDTYEHIVKPISNALKVLKISQHAEQEFEENNRLLKELQLKDSVFANIQRDSVDNMMKILLETRLLNSHIWNPIEARYQLCWYNTKVKQLQYRLENIQESRQRDIDKYQQMSARETRVSGSSMDFYYSTMEDIKTRLQQMQAKFDREYDAIENRIAQKRARLEKLHDQRKFLTEEMQRFHDEIELMRIREQREAESMERKKLEEEALALKKKQRKGKNKGTKSEKNKEIKRAARSPAPAKINGPAKIK